MLIVIYREHRVDDQGRQIRAINYTSEGIYNSFSALLLIEDAFKIENVHWIVKKS